MNPIDLNCDMGEGCPNDAELMDLVSSVNVACGYHVGDAETMKRTVELAVARGVAIGAHPGYPDPNNFGRTPMDLTPDEIFAVVTEQIAALQSVCVNAGVKLTHVKPHGALYNQAARDATIAAAIADAVRNHDPKLILFGLSGSVSITEGSRAGLRTASEVFADRTYSADGSLTPRSEPNALVKSAEKAAEQALRMVTDGTVITVGGKIVPVIAETICIHGDGTHAVEFAAAIRTKLFRYNIKIQPLNG